MASVNKVILVGNLGDDPESRSLNNGGEVVNLRVATSETWKDKEGNRQERTEWHRVVIFNENLGRVAKSYLKKGSKVYLEGQIQNAGGDGLGEKIEELRQARDLAEREINRHKERVETLTKEKEDVAQGVAKLRRAITTLNNEGRARLLRAFE